MYLNEFSNLVFEIPSSSSAKKMDKSYAVLYNQVS